MKKNLLCIIFLITFFESAHSQPWIEQNSGVTTTLTSVYNVDDYNVWVCGYNGVVLKTTNGGGNWLNVSSNGIPNNVSLVNIFASSGSYAITTGYIDTTNTYVYRTTNGGSNWVQVFSQQNGFINAVWIKSPTAGFIYGNPVGGRWSLWKSSNNGANWDSSGLYIPQNGSEAGWNNALIYMGSRIWFGTSNSRIYYSTNDGANWSYQPTGSEANSYIIWIFGLDQTSGVAGGSNLIKTTNYGGNWTPLPSLGTGNISGISGGAALETQVNWLGYLYYSRSNNTIFHSGNGGNNWSIIYTAPAGNYRHISLSLMRQFAWAVRSNGGISKGPVLFGDIKKISSEIPSSFYLKQNYPNPFNPITVINFDLPVSASVKLSVYDVLGKETVFLVNEHLKAGIYEIQWDATNYPSGVYFYKLITADYSETRKMILIK